jgi:putative nucleotidyltransferase with HDIG domain
LRILREVWDETRRGQLATVRTLMDAVDAVDPFSRGHSLRVSRMCVQTARELGMGTSEVEMVEVAALLHDVGRTAVRRELRFKPGRLTKEERSRFREHPRIGRDVVRELRFHPQAAEIVHCHHEQPDGKGYPRGLSGKLIPLGSRIISVVAAFDAMTSDRPYRRGLAPDAACEELRANAGTQFDADVVEFIIMMHGSGLLYEGFTDSELESLADTSQAISLYLESTGRGGMSDWEAEKSGPDSDTVPVIELAGEDSEGDPVADSGLDASDETFELGKQARLRVAGLTNVGCRRSNNEDAHAQVRTERGVLLVLADGMGGAVAGEIASRIAVERVTDSVIASEGDMMSAESLGEAISKAHQAIAERAQDDSRLSGMGTTCTAVHVERRRFCTAHVGDSRAYLVREGKILRLTRDHTLAAELERAAGAEAAAVGASYVLTRCLGAVDDPEPDVTGPEPLQEGDVLLLCSDGLTNLVGDREISEVVGELDPPDACRRLIEMARERGAPDNVTVQVARIRTR